MFYLFGPCWGVIVRGGVRLEDSVISVLSVCFAECEESVKYGAMGLTIVRMKGTLAAFCTAVFTLLVGGVHFFESWSLKVGNDSCF